MHQRNNKIHRKHPRYNENKIGVDTIQRTSYNK